jgi:hypothetical protein
VARRLAKAVFVANAAAEAGISIDLSASLPAVISVTVPPNALARSACEESFKAAVSENLPLLLLLSADGGTA